MVDACKILLALSKGEWKEASRGLSRVRVHLLTGYSLKLLKKYAFFKCIFVPFQIL